MNNQSTKSAVLAATLVMLGLAIAGPAQAAHTSTTYAQPVWFEWHKTDLNVIVVPPDHGQIVNYGGGSTWLLGGNGVNELNPYTSTYMQAVEDSIQAWETAWMAASPWLAANLNVNVYVVGRDFIPEAALLDPDILVTTEEETNAYLGVAVLPGIRPIGVPDCIVSNTKMFVYSLTYNDMYNLNLQEYGHCLGLEHVHGNIPNNDAMDGLYRYPVGNQANPKKCLSNLNILGLERVFNGLGGSATIDRSDYACV